MLLDIKFIKNKLKIRIILTHKKEWQTKKIKSFAQSAKEKVSKNLKKL